MNKFLAEAIKSGNLITEAIEKMAKSEVLLECQRLTNNYFCLFKNKKLVGKIPTKCNKPEQIEAINQFLKSHNLLDADTDVVLEMSE